MNIPFDSRLFVTLLIFFLVVWWMKSRATGKPGPQDIFDPPHEPDFTNDLPPDGCNVQPLTMASMADLVEQYLMSRSNN